MSRGGDSNWIERTVEDAVEAQRRRDAIIPPAWNRSPEQKALSRKWKNRVVAEFNKIVKLQDFQRAKTSFWARPREHVVECVHLHKFRSCDAFRIHSAIRVWSDDFPAVALNGPNCEFVKRGVGFDYGEDPASQKKCADLLAEWVRTTGENWFRRWSDLNALLSHSDSPIRVPESARGALTAQLRGEFAESGLEVTKRVLLVRKA